MSNVKNRPEIDDLRAIAVIPVVLYHTAVGFPGGYIGVDVFFVISGYLISSLILNDINAGTFKIVDFWERRVRRILPALTFVVLACIFAGWCFFNPSDFEQFGRSVAYQSLLISNVFFWKTSGYFSSGDTQPLLHTWSLAVEEQFYIVFPFLLVALAKFAKRAMITVLGTLAVLSFGLSIYATRFHPTMAFYLLPPRAWELLLGALLAASYDVGPTSDLINESLSWAGLFGILLAVFCYDRDTPFPGFAALLPCAGAALIIWANTSHRTSLGKLLSLRPLVFMGLISYSLYLWHWPLLVFTKYWYSSSSQMSLTQIVAIISGSLLLATLSWKIIETPFRRRAVFPARTQIFAFASVALAVLLFAGGSIQHFRGFRSHWPPAALQYSDGQDDKDFRVELDLASVQRGEMTALGRKATDCPIDLLVWGDSHAMAVLHVLDAICTKHNIRAVAATHSATIPLLDFPCSTRYSLKEDSIAYNRAVADYIKMRQIKNVLLVAAWNGYIAPDATEEEKEKFGKSLIETIDFLHDAGARIFIMKDVPKQNFDVPRVLAATARFGGDPAKLGVSLNEHLARTGIVSELFDKLADPSVVVLDPTGLLTNGTSLCRAELNGRALYFDRHHLSIYGEMQLQPLFNPIFLSGAPPAGAASH